MNANNPENAMTSPALFQETAMKDAIPKPITQMQKYKVFATHPLTVLGCVILGAILGLSLPNLSKNLAVVGVVYVDLLKMIVLPFMLSAVIFSLQNLFHEGGAAKIIGRVVVVFAVFASASALLSAGFFATTSLGDNMPESVTSALGKIVGADTQSSNLEMYLRKADEIPKETTVGDVLTSLIPSNIFSALATGDTLKALVFAILFGFAVGQVPTHVSDGLNRTLETVYQACQTLTHWVNLPIPLVLICLAASQLAETGLEPLKAMSGFVITFLALSTLLLVISTYALSRRASVPFLRAAHAMRAPFALGVATNNSVTCMPAMIESLVKHLGFSKTQVELLVPLSVSLLKVGAVAYFVCATLFVAELYDRPIGMADMGIVVIVSILSGFASSGMAGIVTITLVGTVCGYLNLPFEAAFILFVAVDPLCAMARTAVTVVAGCASVAIICPKPPPPPPPEPLDSIMA